MIKITVTNSNPTVFSEEKEYYISDEASSTNAICVILKTLHEDGYSYSAIENGINQLVNFQEDEIENDNVSLEDKINYYLFED